MKRDFEALYKVAMSMADTCIGEVGIEKRFEKLHEEFQELIEAFSDANSKETLQEHNYAFNHVKDELADLLFVLLHIGHKLNISPFQLLHQASSKMLSRMNDPNYTPKN